MRNSEWLSPVCNVFPSNVFGGPYYSRERARPWRICAQRTTSALPPSAPYQATGRIPRFARDDIVRCIGHLSSPYPPEASAAQWLQPVAISRLQP